MDRNTAAPARHALVVETEPVASRVCTEALRQMGYVAHLADSGIGAVTAARRYRPQVIFVAQQLRDVSGREAIRWLRSNPDLRATSIVVLDSVADEGPNPDPLRATAHLRKPISAAALEKTMKEIAALTLGGDDASN